MPKINSPADFADFRRKQISAFIRDICGKKFIRNNLFNKGANADNHLNNLHSPTKYSYSPIYYLPGRFLTLFLHHKH